MSLAKTVFRVGLVSILAVSFSQPASAQRTHPPQKFTTPHKLTVYWYCENGMGETDAIEIECPSLAACEALTDEAIENALREAYPDFNCCDEGSCPEPVVVTEGGCEAIISYAVCPPTTPSWKVQLIYSFGNGMRRGFVGSGRTMCEARRNAWCQVCKYARKNGTCVCLNTGNCTVKPPCCGCRNCRRCR